MRKEQLIEVLTSVKFVCVDEPNKDDDVPWVKLSKNRDQALAFLEGHMKRWDCTESSLKAVQTYSEEPNWDNFHNATHFLLINKIIHFLKTGEGVNMELAIKLSLEGCGVVSSEVINALKSLTRPQQKAA